MNRQNGTRAARSRRYVYLSYVLLPFILVGILEGILRLTNVGTRTPLFVAAPATGYLQPNEAVIKRFFFRPDEAPQVRPTATYFLETKPEDGIRIVVQGASTAAGFPFGRAASPGAMLRQRLQRGFPERTVEVIDTAIPAVNSFALLNFADEIVDIEPDAVVIYVGHNEFLGILGVGSALGTGLSPELNRLVLDLRRFNLVEAGFQVYGAAAAASRKGTGTLMEQMAGQKEIPYGSQWFAEGHRQFRENLTLLLETYRRHRIPVFIGTLASNEKDQPPFIPTDLTMSVATPWNDARRSFVAAMATGDGGAATMEASQLVKLAPENAMSWYLQGKAELLKDRSAEARHAFLKAKDLDQLRFRAPESFNDIVRSAALENDATLVDVQQALALASPDRVIGGETMLDHLHPDVEGYFLMADAFFNALVGSGSLGEPSGDVDPDTARSDIPVTEIDRLVGRWRIERSLHGWPFAESGQPYSPPAPKNKIQGIARAWYEGRVSWDEAMSQALDVYVAEMNTGEIIRVATGLAMAYPYRPAPAYLAGSTLLTAGDPERALPFLQRASELEPDDTGYLFTLAEAFAAAGRTADALVVLDRVLKIDPGDSRAPVLKGTLRPGSATGD